MIMVIEGEFLNYSYFLHPPMIVLYPVAKVKCIFSKCKKRKMNSVMNITAKHLCFNEINRDFLE
ncbi:hypothetical protein CW752_07635 [Chryseobacterium sp. PMSZPI]|nr:hypothetical protein CW752_07635 [Chryseobacterium sp. PMSZPI]